MNLKFINGFDEIMYKIQEGQMTYEEFETRCIERSLYNAIIPIDINYEQYIIFDDKSRKDNGTFYSKMCVKEIGSEYEKTIHIIKHVYQSENETLYEEDTQLNYNQIECIVNMDKIIQEKRERPKLKLVIDNKKNSGD